MFKFLKNLFFPTPIKLDTTPKISIGDRFKSENNLFNPFEKDYITVTDISGKYIQYKWTFFYDAGYTRESRLMSDSIESFNMYYVAITR